MPLLRNAYSPIALNGAYGGSQMMAPLHGPAKLCSTTIARCPNWFVLEPAPMS
ncbi:hypothetical protein CEV34_3299 [Brucella pseudogrignonensis]|uniref:Uncharacterized protein n=1 Tax=Brucella pseudogrignonensis TaxID=419475 RepID=A0A256GAK9_9HYPH|nr:hypothetical protein CEV34_3299 [Brucella pseudogrignonensis]